MWRNDLVGLQVQRTMHRHVVVVASSRSQVVEIVGATPGRIDRRDGDGRLDMATAVGDAARIREVEGSVSMTTTPPLRT